MKPKTIKLTEHERVVAVVPERCSGPGWANAVVWVHIVDYATGTHRCEDIQPNERTNEMHTLFACGEAIHNALMSAVPVRRARNEPVQMLRRK